MEFSLCLLQQAHLHPAMEPQDAVKLCYQAAFGAEHAAPEHQRALDWLSAELDGLREDEKGLLYEPISENICRVNLAAWKARKLPARWLLNMFLSTAAPGEDFRTLLKTVEKLAGEGHLPFSLENWEKFISAYPVEQPVAVHHSEPYRAAERPAYRIVPAACIELLPVLERMAALTGGIVAIDGRAASGKSTMANLLALVTGAGLVHMDDFFLPMELRSPERLAAPGGNVHYERFVQEVLPKLSGGEGFEYPKFDCSVMAINGSRQVAPSTWRIVEGSYAHHPELGEYMDIRVFRTVEAREQLRRIELRNGKTMARRFKEAWIPMEERYFQHFDIEKNADIVI